MEKTRILIADDHFHERLGIRGALSFFKWLEIVDDVDSAEKAVKLALEDKVDLVTMDIDWYGSKTPGLAAIEEIKKGNPRVRVIVLTHFPEFIQAANDSGADIALDKRYFTNAAFLADKIKEALRMESRSPSPSISKFEKLSDREYDVLKLMAGGNSDKFIGAKLGIAENTVGTHRKAIFNKLQVPNAAAAVAVAFIKGIIKKEDLETSS